MHLKSKQVIALLRNGKFKLAFMVLFFMVWLFSIPIAFLVVCILYPVLYMPRQGNYSFWGIVKSTVAEAHTRLVRGK